jgi:glycosyltransferase involved in cell wall biosynthesis
VFRKYDKVLIHDTSPVMIGVPAVIVKKIQKIPLFFWVLYLWPESLQAAGGINNPKILGAFDKLTTWIYKNSDKILISSKGFEESIKEKGDFGSKIVYFPNWADKALEVNANYLIPDLPKGFIVMFAGNIGEAQDFDHIMEAAMLLKDNQDIHFVFVGDGRKRPWVEKFRDDHQLQNTVHWLGRHPVEAMPAFFEQADVMLMTLKDVSIFSLTAPAKLQAYMSASKPILAMMNGEGPRIIEEASCGFSVPASDSRALADTIIRLSKTPKDELQRLGQNGKSYQQTYFDFEKSINYLEEILK